LSPRLRCMQMNAWEYNKIKTAATYLLRYVFKHEWVCFDELWATVRYRWCTRDKLVHFFEQCCSPESEEHRFQSEMRRGELYVRCIPSSKRQRSASHESSDYPTQEPRDQPRDYWNAPWHQEEQHEPSAAAADASQNRQSSPQPKRAPRRELTLFDAKAAHATAVAAEAAAVAEAVVELANDLKATANNDENWRRKHFQKLIRQWHPDKNLEQTNMSNAVFKYLMEMKKEYLTVGSAASSSTSRNP